MPYHFTFLLNRYIIPKALHILPGGEHMKQHYGKKLIDCGEPCKGQNH
jgi:hypothetical protein